MKQKIKVPKSSIVKIPQWFTDLYESIYQRTRSHYEFDNGLLVGYRMFLLGKQRKKKNEQD